MANQPSDQNTVFPKYECSGCAFNDQPADLEISDNTRREIASGNMAAVRCQRCGGMTIFEDRRLKDYFPQGTTPFWSECYPELPRPVS